MAPASAFPDLDRRRSCLNQLDALLAELEMLNLRGAKSVPEDLGSRLEAAGVRQPQRLQPPKLIESVFDLQRPYLRPNPASVRAGRQQASGPALPAGIFTFSLRQIG